MPRYVCLSAAAVFECFASKSDLLRSYLVKLELGKQYQIELELLRS